MDGDKAVLNVEFSINRFNFCPDAMDMGISGIRTPSRLDGAQTNCWDDFSTGSYLNALTSIGTIVLIMAYL